MGVEPLNRDILNGLNDRCKAGETNACDQVPYQQKVNADEAKTNALKGVAIAVLLPIVVLAAAASQRAQERETPVCYSAWRQALYPC